MIVIRLAEVKKRTGLSKASIYRKAKNGSFPRPRIRLGDRARGWAENEVDAWLAQRDRESAGESWPVGAPA